MQILFLSTWRPHPPDNGSRLRALYLLKALASAHDVTLVSFAAGKATGPLREFGCPLAGVVTVEDDPYRFVKLPQVIKYASPVPLAYWPSRAMQRAIDEVGPTQNWDAVVAIQAPVGRYAIRFKNAARIIDIDTALSYQAHERQAAARSIPARWRTRVSLLKERGYERRLLRHFQLCTVAAPHEVDWVQGLTATARVTVIPNGVDCDWNCPGLSRRQPNTLVYNGSLTYSANFDAMQWFLAEVYPRIRAAAPDVSLVITGSNHGVDSSALALDSSVTLTGRVDDIRIPVSQATVCVAPIRQGGGTRLKILEAMALGTPVIATTKGAEGLDAGDGEHLILADAPEVFARRTVELLADPAGRTRLALAARRLVETRYDWQPIGRRFLGMVEETVAHRRQSPP